MFIGYIWLSNIWLGNTFFACVFSSVHTSSSEWSDLFYNFYGVFQWDMIFNMRFNFALSRLGITSIVCIVSRVRKYVNVLLGIYSLSFSMHMRVRNFLARTHTNKCQINDVKKRFRR